MAGTRDGLDERGDGITTIVLIILEGGGEEAADGSGCAAERVPGGRAHEGGDGQCETGGGRAGREGPEAEAEGGGEHPAVGALVEEGGPAEDGDAGRGGLEGRAPAAV